MQIQSYAAQSLNIAVSAQNQGLLDPGSLRTSGASAGTTSLQEEDRVSLSGDRMTDMEDSDVRGLLSATLNQFTQSAGDALTVHGGLDMGRALRLLEGLEL